MSASAPEPLGEAIDLLGPEDIAYRLDLTAAELKIVHTALVSLFDDLGHDERSTRRIVRSVLDKLPDEHAIRAIDLGRESRRRRL
jgi:hypothetical protein